MHIVKGDHGQRNKRIYTVVYPWWGDEKQGWGRALERG
jgi:hypothetical protein